MSEVPTTTPISSRTNLPVFTIVAAVCLVGLVILAAIFIPARNQATSDLLVTTVLAALPGMIAAAYSERNSRDMRNGVMEQKAKDGATKALQETGVTDVVEANGRGASSATALAALDAHTAALHTIIAQLSPDTAQTVNVPASPAPSDVPATSPVTGS